MKFDKSGSVVPTFTENNVSNFENSKVKELQWSFNESQIELIRDSCAMHTIEVF